MNKPNDKVIKYYSSIPIYYPEIITPYVLENVYGCLDIKYNHFNKIILIYSIYCATFDYNAICKLYDELDNSKSKNIYIYAGNAHIREIIKYLNQYEVRNTLTITDDKILNFVPGSKEIILGKYAYDFMFENKIIEFNGDYWHTNPKIYDKNYVNKTTGLVAKDIWKKDANKRKYAEKKGYKIYTVWESDYKNNPKDTINKCIKFLTS